MKRKSPKGSKPRLQTVQATEATITNEGEEETPTMSENNEETLPTAVVAPKQPPPPPQEPPEATVTVSQAPDIKRVQIAKQEAAVAVPVEVRMVRVRPRQDIPRCSIGGTWYSFSKGRDVSVPENVRDFLEERAII